MIIPSWQLLSQVFTVETIMTARSQFITWDGIAPLDILWERATQLKVDTIPVEQNEYIVAVLSRGSALPVPLTPEWLVSRDTAIPDVVRVFAEKSKPCLFVFYRQEVIGIVTPADLNKLPARTYFYNLLAELEMLIADRIRHCYRDEEMILSLLRSDRVDNAKRRMERHDLEIDIVNALELTDLLKLARNCPAILSALRISKNRFDDIFNPFDEFRNRVMHPSNLILNDQKGIEKLNNRVQNALNMLNELYANIIVQINAPEKG
jgi:hypothetical protein